MSKSSVRSIKEPKISTKLVQNAKDLGKLAGGKGKAQRVLMPFSYKDAMDSAGKLYVIRAIAGKRRGLVATTKIAKGIRILSYFHSSARHFRYSGIRNPRRKRDRETQQGSATGFLRSGKRLRRCLQQTSRYYQNERAHTRL